MHQAKTRDNSGSTPNHAFRWKRWLTVLLLLLVLTGAGVVGYAWHWLQRPLPQETSVAENALFDGGLVAVGLIDVEKLVALNKYWFGDLDTNALPVDEQQQGLLDELFTGPAGLRDNLKQVLLSLSLPPEEQQGKKLMLLSGRFNADALLGSLNDTYKLDKIAQDRWAVTKKEKPRTEPACKEDEPAKPESFYLRVSPEWVMLVDDQAYGDNIWQRLQSGAAAIQDVKAWRQYRTGRLLSLMALAPANAGKALGGMPGMMAHGAASQAPQVTAIAASVEIDPLKGGLNANFHLASKDAAWNDEAESRVRQKLDELNQNSHAVSATLADLFSRVSVGSQDQALDIDVRLDSQVFSEIGQIVQEGIGSLFSANLSSGGSSGEIPAEKINESPQQYANLNFSSLPAYHDKYSSEQPLFTRGPFAADIRSIEMTQTGLLEIWLEGKVSLPVHEEGSSNNTGQLSISVTSVRDAAGLELLRDELCLDQSELLGKSPNHQEETNVSHQQDNAWVWKHIRLTPDTAVEQIQNINGELSFSMPTHVRRFEVPLKVGEVVEHAGLRFYLSSIKPNAVSYQVSGESERLLEVRGLNKAGQVLQQSWKMGGLGGGQSTQHYEGEVQGLEVYVAERYFRHQKDFELNDIFRAPENEEEDKSPDWFAPKQIEAARWYDYAALDMQRLTVDPGKDWFLWEKELVPVAEGSWNPVRLFITHKPQQWSNNPTAHMYFPMLPELPGVLSALSYRVKEPAAEDGPGVRYETISYPYFTNSGELSIQHELEGKAIAVKNFTMVIGLEENAKLDRLKGEIIFRLPKKTQSNRLVLNELWNAQTVDGVTVAVTGVSRGMFPGYNLKIEGDIEKFVNLHGLSTKGERVMASPVNFQEGGYWTMTLPFGRGINEVELVTAPEQDVLLYPFDFVAEYATE